MKAKRRHELQENVLAIELGRLAEFLRRRGNHLATAVLVLALVALAVVYFVKRSGARELALQGRWDRAMTGDLASPEKAPQRLQELTQLAEQDDEKRIAALASVALGDEFAERQLLTRQPSERAALASRARGWYLRVLSQFPREELAVAKARYGLAKLAESLGQLDKAAEAYRQIKQMSNMTGQPVLYLAEMGLDHLKALESPVRMATTAPATQPTQPASRPATTTPAMPATAPAAPPAPVPAATAPAAPRRPATAPAAPAPGP